MKSPTRTIQARIAVLLVAVCSTLLGTLHTSTSVAAPPPDWYPTTETLEVATNPELGLPIPLRRGFHDADVGIGFGWDKMWNKHNIWSIDAFEPLALSTNVVPSGREYVLNTWAGKMKCSASGCQVTEQKHVKLVFAPYHQSKYYYRAEDGSVQSIPIAEPGGIWGVKTAYCVQGGVWACPNWVTYSLTHPRQHNPYRAPSSEPVAAESPSPKSGEEVSIDSQDGSKPDLSEEESAVYVYSYEPLPASISAHVVKVASEERIAVSEAVDSLSEAESGG